MVPHGDQSIDVSSAAQGALSSSPLSGTSPHQTIQYIFFGIDGKDLLIKMLKSPNCIDGCKLCLCDQITTKLNFGRVPYIQEYTDIP
jgi:hypothetical protein